MNRRLFPLYSSINHWWSQGPWGETSMQHENKLIVASFFNPNVPNSALPRCVAKQLEISVSFFRHVDWRRGKAESAEIAQSSMHKSVAHLWRDSCRSLMFFSKLELTVLLGNRLSLYQTDAEDIPLKQILENSIQINMYELGRATHNMQ